MILILLVSSLQFSIYKMDCLISGNTQISLSDFDDCNQNTTNNSIAQKCCEFGSLTFNFDFETDTNSQNFNVIPSSFVENDINTSAAKKVIHQSDFNFYTNLPPPSGYELIKVVQSFKI